MNFKKCHLFPTSYFWKYIFSSSDDHVFQSSNNLTISIGSQDELVAGFQPTIFCQSFSCALFVVPVFHHRWVSLDPQFPHGSHWNYRPGVIDELRKKITCPLTVSNFFKVLILFSLLFQVIIVTLTSKWSETWPTVLSVNSVLSFGNDWNTMAVVSVSP